MNIINFVKKRYKLLILSFGGTILFRFLFAKLFNGTFSISNSIVSGGILFFIFLKDSKYK